MDVNLSTFDKVEITNMEAASFCLSNFDGNMEICINDALVGNILTSEHETPCKQSITENYDFMKDVVIQDLDDNRVGLLIGAKFARHYFGKKTLMGAEDEPIAVLTDFGWCIVGPLSDREDIVEIAQIDAFDEISNDLERLVKRMYRHDFMSRPEEDFPSEMKHPSREDEFSFEQIYDSLSYNKESITNVLFHGDMEERKL